MEVIKNITKKVEVKKELIFTTAVIEEELKKKYRMTGEDTTAEWQELQDEEGNDLGMCLVLSGVSVPQKRKPKAKAEEAAE